MIKLPKNYLHNKIRTVYGMLINTNIYESIGDMLLFMELSI